PPGPKLRRAASHEFPRQSHWRERRRRNLELRKSGKRRCAGGHLAALSRPFLRGLEFQIGFSEAPEEKEERERLPHSRKIRFAPFSRTWRANYLVFPAGRSLLN